MFKKVRQVMNGIGNHLLVMERMNSQRCIAKDLDTTKTIIDNKKRL